MGLPQYPPLPANIDPSKIDEIRRSGRRLVLFRRRGRTKRETDHLGTKTEIRRKKRKDERNTNAGEVPLRRRTMGISVPKARTLARNWHLWLVYWRMSRRRRKVTKHRRHRRLLHPMPMSQPRIWT